MKTKIHKTALLNVSAEVLRKRGELICIILLQQTYFLIVKKTVGRVIGKKLK